MIRLATASGLRVSVPIRVSSVGYVELGVRKILELSGGLICKRVKQISYGKQREAKNSAPEIKVMANAMLKPPMHPWKQVKCFGDVS